MPVLYVKDRTSLEIVRIEENFSSLVWTERYQETGEFVLDIPINVTNFDVYKRGNYVILDESEDVMMIETLNITEDQEDPKLEVSGRSLSLILERRINASRLLDNYAESITYNGALSDVVSSIVENDITDPYMEYYIWQRKETDGKWYDGYGTPGDSSVVQRRKVKRTQQAPYRKISNFTYQDLISGITLDKK